MNIDQDLSGYARRSKFYRVEYNEKRDIPFFLSFIVEGETTVLEVPCGAGRLTAELARKAKHVTAVDIEPLMISSLEDHIEREGLSDKVTARIGDMTDLSLAYKVDLIIVPSEALQLLPREEGKKALSCLAGLLDEGGILIVDIATFSEHRAGHPDYFDPETFGDDWHPQWTRALPEGGVLARQVRLVKDSEKITIKFKYRLSESNRQDIDFADDMVLYYYDLSWIVGNIPEGISEFRVRSSYSNDRDMHLPSRIIAMFQR